MDEDSLISAQEFTCLRRQLEMNGWQLTGEDGGQSHFVGWEHQARFEREGAVITLIQGERYGQAYFTYEANPKALVQMSALLAPCQN